MQKNKILIVEDEVLVAKEINSTLQKLGYSVTSIAYSASEAIKKVMLHDLPEPRDERDPTIRFRRKCRHCEAEFDGPADVCPFCWKAV